MDHAAERIAEDINAIVHTRMAMAEKLGAIEQHVDTTLSHARTTMTHLADKTAASVRDTMQVTKDALDPCVQAARHPWVVVGGALILGYAGGAFFRRGTRITTRAVPYYPPGAGGAAIMPTNGSSSSEKPRESGVYPFYPHQGADNGRGNEVHTDHPTLWVEVERALHNELGVARESLIQFGRGLLREMVRQAVPALAQVIGGIRRDRDPRADGGAARR